MVAARQVGEIVLRLLGSLAVLYLAAFFELTFGLALAVDLHNGLGVDLTDIDSYAAAAVVILGLVVLGTLPLRGAPAPAQALIGVASLVILAGFARALWREDYPLNTSLGVILAGIGLITLASAWLALQTPIRSPLRAAVLAVVLVAAGMAVSLIARQAAIS
jgi:hypothetical protein